MLTRDHLEQHHNVQRVSRTSHIVDNQCQVVTQGMNNILLKHKLKHDYNNLPLTLESIMQVSNTHGTHMFLMLLL